MKKIPSLFVRDYENIGASFIPGAIEIKKGRFLATEQVTPGCEWVINGEGVATRKWDGTAVLFMDGMWFKRYDAKHGKTPPPGFFEAQPEPDPITGHWPGWILVNPSNPADKYIHEAITTYTETWTDYKSGDTFEAIGPMINGNKDNYPYHYLKLHGEEKLLGGFKFTHTFYGLKEFFEKINTNIEGIVFHHEDGRMCKVKRSDFGLKW